MRGESWRDGSRR
jgi:2-polyprenyl-3-methyl-5-hydroxy-6-metoxy-1,4-benzoquinol methylase